jgi:hypothetical protein
MLVRVLGGERFRRQEQRGVGVRGVPGLDHDAADLPAGPVVEAMRDFSFG